MGYYRRNSAAEGLGQAIGLVWVIGYIAYKASGWTGVVIAFCLITITLMGIALVTHRQSKRKEEERKRMPCSHGVEGARWESVLCQQCIAENEEKQRHLEEERSRQYIEWVKRIRLPEYLKSMHPQEFEELICQLYARLGYAAELTPYTGDGGIDAYLRKGGQTTILQCKRVKGSVGEPVLRDLYGTMRAENASTGLVVTTGKVSRQAREWADGKPIEIIELDLLQDLIRRNFTESDLVPAEFAPQVIQTTNCPKCGSKLRLVKGRWGKFWGCSAYPRCKFTRRRKS
jgi:Restriction endonuclease/Topoisomerase DNA binding C4 zinc finger